MNLPSLKSQHDSISELAQLALHCSGAEGYALYAQDPASGAWIARSSFGHALPEPEDLSRPLSERDGIAMVSYPLRVDGSAIAILAFSFREALVPDKSLAILDRMARIIERVYCFPHAATQAFAKINRLETDLMTAKISARAQALLGAALRGDAGDAIVHHAESVLRSSRLRAALDSLLREGEEEIRARKLAGQAKALLQKNHGMSEEQAHLYLRFQSRRSRRRICEVAQALIAGTESVQPRRAG